MSTVVEGLTTRRPHGPEGIQPISTYTPSHRLKYQEPNALHIIDCGEIEFNFPPGDLTVRLVQLKIQSVNRETQYPFMGALRLCMRERIPSESVFYDDYFEFQQNRFHSHGWRGGIIEPDGNLTFRFNDKWLEKWVKEHPNEPRPDPVKYQINGDYKKNLDFGPAISRLVERKYFGMPEGFREHPVVRGAKANYFPTFETEKEFYCRRH